MLAKKVRRLVWQKIMIGDHVKEQTPREIMGALTHCLQILDSYALWAACWTGRTSFVHSLPSYCFRPSSF